MDETADLMPRREWKLNDWGVTSTLWLAQDRDGSHWVIMEQSNAIRWMLHVPMPTTGRKT